MEDLLSGLRAAGESTRLRLLALCASSELTVTELTHILGQSQPRVSRHLKLLWEAGLLRRTSEGAWVFFRVVGDGPAAALARALIDQIPTDDPTIVLDRQRLDALKQQRAREAEAYFRKNAPAWDRIRSMHVKEDEVERSLLSLLPPDDAATLLDIGTGTGRILRLLGPHVGSAVGIDRSREMLAVARANLEHAGLHNCVVRHGDLYQLPWADGSFDAATLHMVLHFIEDPARAIAEAARVLRRHGRLVIVDFAPHDLDELRRDHAHRRLGFAVEEVDQWCRDAGLEPARNVDLPGARLTVTLWSAVRVDRVGLAAVPRAASA